MWHVAAWLQTLWVCQTIFLHHMWSYRVIRFVELYRWIFEILWVYQCLWHTLSKRAFKVTPKMPKDFNLWSQRQRFSNPTRLVLHFVLSRTCTVPDVAVCKSLQEDYHQLCRPQMSSWQNAVEVYKSCIDYPALFIQIFSRCLEDIIDTVQTGEWLLSWMFFLLLLSSLWFPSTVAMSLICKVSFAIDFASLPGSTSSGLWRRWWKAEAFWGTFCRTWPRESYGSCVVSHNLFLWLDTWCCNFLIPSPLVPWYRCRICRFDSR